MGVEILANGNVAVQVSPGEVVIMTQSEWKSFVSGKSTPHLQLVKIEHKVGHDDKTQKEN